MTWLPEKHFPRTVTNLPPPWPIFCPNVFLNHVTEEYLHTTQIFLLKIASSTSIPGFKKHKQSPTKNFGAGMWLCQLVSTTIFHLPEITTKWRWAALFPGNTHTHQSLAPPESTWAVLCRWRAEHPLPIGDPCEPRSWDLQLVPSARSSRNPGVGGLPKPTAGLFYGDYPRLF